MNRRFSPYAQTTLSTRGAASALTTAILFFSSQVSMAQFVQQGPKLTDITARGASQGSSVAVSADGNTALVGGPVDHNFVGAAWVYIRDNNSWVQQGSKLIGNGAVGDDVAQGWSVALSGDGNTALVGGIGDKNASGVSIYEGAVWVYSRENGVWNDKATSCLATTVSDRATRFLRSAIW